MRGFFVSSIDRPARGIGGRVNVDPLLSLWVRLHRVVAVSNGVIVRDGIRAIALEEVDLVSVPLDERPSVSDQRTACTAQTG